MSLTFETRIAAAATAQDPKQMRQEFSRVLQVPAVTNGRKRHRLAFREVLYFKLKGSLEAEGVQLNPDDRRDLYRVLTARTRAAGGWLRHGHTLVRAGDVPVTLNLTKIVRSTQMALRMALSGDALIESRPDICSGLPVFRGTRVPLNQVVEQIRAGVPMKEIAEDYPQINAEALRYAQLCTRMGQAPGRPSKALTLRRTAREATHR